MSHSPGFVAQFRARWSDMDFNQHMKNAAFLGCSEDTRMMFLDANGFTIADFARLRIGPVILEERLIYKGEIHLLERFSVDLMLVGITSDARRMVLRSRFVRDSDQALCAIVESTAMWLNLDQRRTVPPPPELGALWLGLPRTEDFRDLDAAR